MNEIFKNNNPNKIILDKLYSLQPDGFRGLVLVFEEERTRKKLDSKTKKETGESEQYIFTEKYYYPKLSQSLTKYLKLSLNVSKDLEDIKNTLERIENKIAEISAQKN